MSLVKLNLTILTVQVKVSLKYQQLVQLFDGTNIFCIAKFCLDIDVPCFSIQPCNVLLGNFIQAGINTSMYVSSKN